MTLPEYPLPLVRLPLQVTYGISMATAKAIGEIEQLPESERTTLNLVQSVREELQTFLESDATTSLGSVETQYLILLMSVWESMVWDAQSRSAGQSQSPD